MTRILLALSFLLNSSVILAQEPPSLPPIIKAASQNDVNAVKKLLKANTDIHTKDNAGRTALHHAAANNHVSVCTLLLENGANIETKGKDGGTPLNSASQTGAYDTSVLLLDNGANIDAKFLGNMTSLNMALHKKKTALTLTLIQRGANVTLANDARIAPMDIILKFRFDKLFWPVLNAFNIEPDKRDAILITYLDIAVSRDNLNLFNTILEKEPHLSINDGIEIDLFFKAAECGSRTMLDYFLNHGRSIDEFVPLTKWTLLHLATRENNTDLMTFLMGEGIPVDSKDARLWTPLHIAAYLNHAEAARLLIEKNISIEAQDESGSTPLHLAAAQGNTEMIRLLIAQGASPAALTYDKKTPLDVALLAGHTHLSNVFPPGTATINLSDSGYTGTMNDLREAVLKNESETVKRILEKANIPINKPDKYGMSLLHYAADLGNPDITRYLINAHAEINVTNPMSSWTPLLHAVNGEHNNVVKILLMEGADPNTRDVRGWTALHIAMFQSNEELTNALRVSGARDDLRNNANQSPEDIAGERNAYLQALQSENKNK